MNANLACAAAYVIITESLCLDDASTSPAVQNANLLCRLPVADAIANLVNSSHFLDHIPPDHVAPILQERWRILKPSGPSRLVVPDLESLCRTYPAATCLSRPKRELGKFGDAPSRSLRFPQPEVAVMCERLRVDQVLHGIHLPPSRSPLPFARCAFRCPAPQASRAPVHRGAGAPLELSDAATSVWGGQHG